MASTVDRLRPGIVSLFARKGYTAKVTEVAGKLVVTVTKGDEYHEAHSYPIPSTNKELSVPLCRWRDELS